MSAQRKLQVLALTLCLLLVPVLASADFMVQVNDKIKFGLNGTWEGPFSADVQRTGSGVDFYTFCVETTEYFSPSSEYIVKTISSNVVSGIASIPDSKLLQSETAYLYRQFLNNPGFAPTNVEKDALQAAIYHFQGVGGIAVKPGTTQDWLYGLAADGVTWQWFSKAVNDPAVKTIYDAFLRDATTNAKSGKYYNVAVLNMVDSSGGQHQDMLTAVPLPGAVLLLGAGLARLAAYARRRRED
jgi:hypothetical protein